MLLKRLLEQAATERVRSQKWLISRSSSRPVATGRSSGRAATSSGGLRFTSAGLVLRTPSTRFGVTAAQPSRGRPRSPSGARGFTSRASRLNRQTFLAFRWICVAVIEDLAPASTRRPDCRNDGFRPPQPFQPLFLSAARVFVLPDRCRTTGRSKASTNTNAGPSQDSRRLQPKARFLQPTLGRRARFVQQETPPGRGFSRSPLPDSNRRPPPYHGTSHATGGNPRQWISLVLAGSAPI
jgi:hypothetical protein